MMLSLFHELEPNPQWIGLIGGDWQAREKNFTRNKTTGWVDLDCNTTAWLENAKKKRETVDATVECKHSNTKNVRDNWMSNTLNEKARHFLFRIKRLIDVLENNFVRFLQGLFKVQLMMLSVWLIDNGKVRTRPNSYRNRRFEKKVRNQQKLKYSHGWMNKK